MKREWRYWIQKVSVETIECLLISAGIAAVFTVLIWGGLEHICVGGWILLLITNVWALSVSTQTRKQMTVSLLFGSTRKSSFAWMQISLLTVLLAVEIIQALLILLPWNIFKMQLVLLCYTPILFLLMTGIGLLLSIVEQKNAKMYHILSRIILVVCVWGMGFFCSMVMRGNQKLHLKTYDRWLGKQICVTAACAALLVYIAGAAIYRRIAVKMDVKQ